MANVRVKNKKTGVESSISQADFDKISQDNNWFNVFVVIPEVPAPKEIAEKKKEAKSLIVPNVGSVGATATGGVTTTEATKEIKLDSTTTAGTNQKSESKK